MNTKKIYLISIYLLVISSINVNVPSEIAYNKLEISKIFKVEKIREKLYKIYNLKGDIQYFSVEQNRSIKTSDILRYKFKRIIKDIDKTIDISNVDFNTFDITNDSIVFGTDKKISLDLEKYRRIFKSNIGLPSLYEHERLIPKTRAIDYTKKHIAFTFDDGPLNENHVKIREIFKGEDRASFCVVGINVKKHPEMIYDTYLEGHQIINHSYSHKDFRKISEEERWQEFSKTSDEIFKITGYDVDKIRLPYGAFNTSVKQEFGKNIVGWNVDSLDWQFRNTEQILEHLKDSLKDGKIVLFHDLYDSSYESVKILYDKLKDDNFQFVTFDEMLEINKMKNNKN